MGGEKLDDKNIFLNTLFSGTTITQPKNTNSLHYENN